MVEFNRRARVSQANFSIFLSTLGLGKLLAAACIYSVLSEYYSALFK